MTRRDTTGSENGRPTEPVDVLIVDDDANKRFALSAILGSLGENVVEAGSGSDALRQLLRGDFAVVLLDVRMPVMDGFETARLIRKAPRSELTPIIFVTALDQAETDMGRGYDLGAVDFVFAPIVPAILRAKVAVFVELYRAQQELRRYRAQLEAMVEERTIIATAVNRELEAFSHALSNDLHAPLQSLDALGQKLLDGYGDRFDATANAYMKGIREAGRRMSQGVEGLQTLFRLTRGEIHRQAVDISALSEQIVDALRASSNGRRVEVEIAPAITASADGRLVRILLTNLIDNAWKFTGTKSSPRIAIGAEAVDGETRVFVKDNGVGFDMIDAHRLFGPFQRLHSQDEFAGTGIGLAAARRIVHRHGGRIWAEGVAGEGATFYFVL